MLDHGFPETIQCDNGLEFQGKPMKSLIENNNIKIIHGRPCHPQSQGKCERSNQSLRRKIFFACRRKGGFNWASDLKQIAHSINTSAKRVLGNMTPFQVYNGRNHSGYQKPLSSKEIKRKLTAANKSFRRRQLKHAKTPSKYEIRERVLLRYPFTKSRVPRKRHIISDIVKDTKSGGRYLVQFNDPKNKVTVEEWVGVENLTSLTLDRERQKQRTVNEHRSRKDRSDKKLHRERYYKVLNYADKIQMLDSEFPNCVKVLMNPEPNGNCQFAAIQHQLQLYGIFKAESVLRKESVEHLIKNRSFYEQFVHGSSFSDYLRLMSQDGSYGDNLTLFAIMRNYNMQCLVVSAVRSENSTLVSNDGIYDINLPLISLGHFPENEGMHYVSVSADVKRVLEFLEERSFPIPGPESPSLYNETEQSSDSEPAQSPASEPTSNSEPAQSPASEPTSEPAHSPASEPTSDSEPAQYQSQPRTRSQHRIQYQSQLRTRSQHRVQYQSQPRT